MHLRGHENIITVTDIKKTHKLVSLLLLMGSKNILWFFLWIK